MIAHARSGEHYARVERERIDGESYLLCLTRLAVEDAVAAAETHAGAAKLLGCSRTNIAHVIQRGIERRANAAIGQPERNARGTKPGTRWSPAMRESRARANLRRVAS